jgi:N-acetyl-gamma-glutamyl-phosphate reductase
MRRFRPARGVYLNDRPGHNRVMPMFERFTDRARKVLTLANQEAQKWGREQVGPQHVLFALLADARGVAAHVLSNMKVDLASARAAAEQLVSEGKRTGRVTDVPLPLSPGAMGIVSQARLEARLLNHSYVGTEHLLLAILQQHESVAAQAMIQLGLRPERAQSEVAALVTASPPEPAPQREADTGGSRIRVGIVGVSGYGGGEVLRLCAAHPTFEVAYVAGESSAGSSLGERFPGISRPLDQLVIQKWDPATLPGVDLLFASLPTGESREAMARVPPTTNIVDIGGDHRFVEGWTYGLADIWPDPIRSATRVANPGCYPAAAITALAPLLAHLLIEPAHIIIDAKSGASGAGRGGGSTFGFAELNEDLSAYGLLKHSHVPEMTTALSQIAGREASLTFTPHLVPMSRGLLVTCYARGRASTEQCLEAARTFYSWRPFVRVVNQPPHTKWAAGSNLAFVTYASDPTRNLVIALCAIDNLGKGAAGQAIQNANLMTGQPETAGLENSPLWP